MKYYHTGTKEEITSLERELSQIILQLAKMK